jgi:hypothetical protein
LAVIFYNTRQVSNDNSKSADFSRHHSAGTRIPEWIVNWIADESNEYKRIIG